MPRGKRERERPERAFQAHLQSDERIGAVGQAYLASMLRTIVQSMPTLGIIRFYPKNFYVAVTNKRILLRELGGVFGRTPAKGLLTVEYSQLRGLQRHHGVFTSSLLLQPIEGKPRKLFFTNLINDFGSLSKALSERGVG